VRKTQPSGPSAGRHSREKMMLMASLSHSYEEMGQNLDVSRQRIEQILRKLGIKPKVKAILQKNRQRLKGGR